MYITQLYLRIQPSAVLNSLMSSLVDLKLIPAVSFTLIYSDAIKDNASCRALIGCMNHSLEPLDELASIRHISADVVSTSLEVIKKNPELVRGYNPVGVKLVDESNAPSCAAGGSISTNGLGTSRSGTSNKPSAKTATGPSWMKLGK